MIRWLEDVEPVSTPYWMKRLREGNNESDQDAQAFEEWDLSSIQEGEENLEEDDNNNTENAVMAEVLHELPGLNPDDIGDLEGLLNDVDPNAGASSNISPVIIRVIELVE